MPSILDLQKLDSHTLLLAIEPRCCLPASILAFVERGGWLLAADETGKLSSLWTSLGLNLHPSSRRGMALHAATVRSKHPMTRNMSRLWTNRSGYFSSVRGHVLADLGSPKSAVVLDIAFGKGTILAFADASIFINLMLEYQGNGELLENLLDWAAASGKSHVVIFTGDCRAQTKAPSSHDPRNALGAVAKIAGRLDHVNPGPDILFVAAMLLMGLTLAALAFKLPMGKGLDGSWVVAPSQPDKNDFGDGMESDQTLRDYGEPAIGLREELDEILAHRLGLLSPLFEARPTKSSLESRLGKPMARLFIQLHRSCARLPIEAGQAPVSRRRFVRLYRMAVRLLDGLDARPSWMKAPSSNNHHRRRSRSESGRGGE